MDDAELAWTGGADAVLALVANRAARREIGTLVAAVDPTTRRTVHGIPDFVLESQAACIGLPIRLEPSPTGSIRRPPWRGDITQLLAESAARRIRAVIVHAAPPLGASSCGRFLDDPSLAAEVRDHVHAQADTAEALGTLAVDGPMFQRRLDVVAEDVVRDASGWRLELSLRGC